MNVTLHVLHHPVVGLIPDVEFQVNFVLLSQVPIFFQRVNSEKLVIAPALPLFKIRAELSYY